MVGREELLASESAAYHGEGTCTFYGTANSNQMLMEIMGLQLPGSSFVNPGTELRALLNEEAVKVAANNSQLGLEGSLSNLITEKVIVNGIIGLLATGGSTNHTIHLIAIARAAGIIINWSDMSDLSDVVPLITRMYPNGGADVNHFHASGGMGFVIHTLLENNLLHEDVHTILGKGLKKYTQEPKIENKQLVWKEGAKESLNNSIIRPVNDPFSEHGGIKILQGNIGRAVIKTAAVSEEHLVIEAEAQVFYEQEDLIKAFKNGELEKDFIAVLPFQGPKQNGMPELHKLTPPLAVLQNKGFKVAIVTDGRMSGASGKIPAAIHLSPEASANGPIGKIRNGDTIRLNALVGTLNVLVDEDTWHEREYEVLSDKHRNDNAHDIGRELFAGMRKNVLSAEEGAVTWL